MIPSEIDSGKGQIEANDIYRVYKVVNHQGESTHYIATRKGDANGQYCKHVLLNTHSQEGGKIIVGGEPEGISDLI